jgi:hypothetical protein
VAQRAVRLWSSLRRAEQLKWAALECGQESTGVAGKARGLGEARMTRSGPTERERRCRPTTEQDQGKGVVPHRHCDRVNDPCATAIRVRKPGAVKQSCGRNRRHADPTTAAPTPLRRAHA